MNPQRKTSSSLSLDPAKSRQIQGGVSVAALVLVPLLAVAGGDDFRAFLDFGAGVLSLLSLSGAVVWGLIATDRLLLSPRHRLLAQGVHRATAVASLGFLLLHVTVKVSLGHVALIGALVPFGLGIDGANGLIGFGSLAGLLMIVAATTGAMRSAFALPGRFAGRWRAVHMLAYPAWCFALVHGLFAGRPAATYVTTLYCLTLAGVAAAVSVRLFPRPLKRRIADKIVTLTGADGTNGTNGAAGAARETAESEPSRRDLASDPLPGAIGVPPQPRYAGRLQREPAMPGPSLGSPLDPPRSPPRLAAPSPPLYEAPRPSADPAPAVDPLADTFIAPRADAYQGLGADPLADTGTGLSAGYRAVSLGTEATTRMPMPPPPPGPPPGGIPLAERIPMTEEIPVIPEEPTGRQGGWPAPSPPRPGQASAPPTSTPYDSGAIPAYESGAYASGAYASGAYASGAYASGAGSSPRYAPDTPPPYDAGPASAYGPTGTSPYGTGAYDTGSVPAYGTGAVPPYDTGSTPAHENRSYEGGSYEGRSYEAQASAFSGPAFPGTAAPGPASPGQAAPPRATPDPVDPPPGPLYPPPAGEPWHAPAGDRP
ncbi:betaine aldehyde dehydrogenase [Streptomyces sp. L-9-10]|uniref:ferric reductase-like transmembrane domain-containing protein n=1 Tax=Streptomyces sp. L-9-10 TaxID=1478131 RepID=UPI00101DD735|nr:ferric reductase-like transmembrane domain-containing protein [Streptomyces sp. L-9-10]RYJ23975.1 betaine aldehyde dehydrogenase [Streptomyces sp. L-9-10]